MASEFAGQNLLHRKNFLRLNKEDFPKFFSVGGLGYDAIVFTNLKLRKDFNLREAALGRGELNVFVQVRFVFCNPCVIYD